MFGFGESSSFDPSNDIPDLKGKVVLVTGGNSGLGAETIKQVARHNPSEIWLAARTQATAKSTVDNVKKLVPNANILVLELDLGSFSSINKAANEFLSRSKRLDVLFLNAGVTFSPPSLTESGYSLQFGTNHIGHALLTKLLLPRLLSTAAEPKSDVRIVILSSDAHRIAGGGIDFETLTTEQANMSPFSRYGKSKLANVLFGRSLATRYPNITTVSLHPGRVTTPGVNSFKRTYPRASAILVPLFNLSASSTEVGVLTQLWAAFSDRSKIENGGYYEPVGKKGRASRYATDIDLEMKLWDWTEAELAKNGYGGWP